MKANILTKLKYFGPESALKKKLLTIAKKLAISTVSS